MTLLPKIATAATSREIFLVNDYDGVFKDRVETWRLRRKCTPIPASRDFPHREGFTDFSFAWWLPTKSVRLPPRRGKQVLSLRRTHPLTSVAYGATSFPRKEANDSRLRRSWEPDDSAHKTCH